MPRTPVLIVAIALACIPALLFAAPGGRFGRAVTAVGNDMLIGAPGWSWSDKPGAAYLFDASNGDLLRTFLSPTPDADDMFGHDLLAMGNHVLISDPGDTVGGLWSGAAYLFDATTGALMQTFHSPSPSDGDSFGYDVAFLGNNVLVGALDDDTGAVNAGAAYLLDASSGAILHKFHNPTPDHNDFFGHSTSLLGEHVLIAAPFGLDPGLGVGSAQLYNVNNQNFIVVDLYAAAPSGPPSVLPDRFEVRLDLGDLDIGNYGYTINLFVDDVLEEVLTGRFKVFIPEPTALMLLFCAGAGILSRRSSARRALATADPRDRVHQHRRRSRHG